MQTNTFLKSLKFPQAKPNTSRRVWSIDLETVWLPVFTVTNLMGNTAIPDEALGAPLRLAYNTDKTVRFSSSDRPVIRVAKEISDNVRLVRDQFVANMLAEANGYMTENPEAYKSARVKAIEAGKPIMVRDDKMLQSAYAKMLTAEVEAELKAKAEVKAEAKPNIEAEVKAEKKAEVKAEKKPKAKPKTVKKPADVPAEIPADVPADGANPEPTREPVLVS